MCMTELSANEIYDNGEWYGIAILWHELVGRLNELVDISTPEYLRFLVVVLYTFS